MLTRLTYYSEAAPGLTRQAVDAILSCCRRRNPSIGVTGALAWDGRFFVQMLEGHRITLSELLLRIGADPRNQNLVLVDMREVRHRLFPNWNMADVSGFGAFTGGVGFEPFAMPGAQLALHLDEALGQAVRAGRSDSSRLRA